MGIELSLKEYENGLRDWVEDLYDYAQTRRDRALSKVPSLKSLALKLEQTGSDVLEPLVKALKSENLDDIIEHRSLMFAAMRQGLSSWKYDDPVDHLSIFRALDEELDNAVTYLQAQEEVSPVDLREEYDNLHKETLEKVKTQGAKVLDTVRDAAKRAPNFSTKSVTVGPQFNKDSSDPGEAPGVYYVRFGNGSMAPGFSLFVESTGKVASIEDLLEGGDTDFFRSTADQQDYFNLVHEIQKPGSTQQGKWVKVYTARPVKDRRTYEGAHSVPANIFLATTLDEAEGLSRELPGHGVRDVWSMLVNTRDVVLTLDMGRLKHYQAVRETPVRNMELVIPGDAPGRIARRWLLG